MKQRVALFREHPVDIVHRISAAVLGLGLWVFAGIGFASGLAFFSTQGQRVLGLSNNGALSTLSVVAGAVLLGSAFWGGRLASTVTNVVGGLFLLSGLVHLAILHTQLNVLAFRISNVLFSLVVGMVLLFLGLYGRVTGGLPPDNPYRLAHPRRSDRPHPEQQTAASISEYEQGESDLRRAELAMGQGTATPEQEQLVLRDQRQRRAAERERTYRRVRHDRRNDAGSS